MAFALAARALFTTATTSAWLLSVVLKVSTQKARYWLAVWAAAPTEANDSPIKRQAPRQAAPNGWPPVAKLRSVRFSMVFLRKPWAHHESVLWGLWDPIGSYGTQLGPISPIRPIHDPQGCLCPGAKNCSVRLRSGRRAV